MNDILMIAIPLTFYVITSYIGYRILLKSIDAKIQITIDEVGKHLEKIFTPRARQGNTILGKAGSDARTNNAIQQRMAIDILNSPKISALKSAAKFGLGIDIDSYIEEDGAVETLENIQAIANLVGFDIMSILQSGMDGMNLSVGHEANSGVNYYLRS
ncbi:unnamed protein product [marine sediment metagenome]|uniref:Uncharacterized protein n=2 Tax=marine sediment metagenome TaxID=412755 RepID=X1JAE6_9ZZZZ